MFYRLYLKLDPHELYACAVGTSCLVQCLLSEALLYCWLCCCCIIVGTRASVRITSEQILQSSDEGEVQQIATHRTVRPFVQGHEDWVSYAEHLQQYFTANNIDAAAKQRAILLSLCGAGTYQLIRNLVVAHKPANKSFKQLVDLVQAHYCLPPLVIVQRFAFNKQVQREGETAAEFVAECRKLSEQCQFGAFLNEMLHNQLELEPGLCCWDEIG